MWQVIPINSSRYSIEACISADDREIQNRCVNMVAHLFNAPKDKQGVGTATVGSSEAIHLAGLALKWNWRDRRKAQGKSADRPNIVMGANVQVCWEKFARYLEVEHRYVPLTQDRYVLGVPEALEMVDENTIAVVGILKWRILESKPVVFFILNSTFCILSSF